MVKGIPQKKGVDYDEILSPVYKNGAGHGSQHGLGSGAVRCQNCLFAWRFRGRNLHAPTGRIRGEREGEPGVPVEEELIWTEASSPAMVPKVRILNGRSCLPTRHKPTTVSL